MAKSSAIEWTESTWNPVTGCTKTSPGCLNCYAEPMANRLRAMGHPNYQAGFRVSVHEHTLAIPLQWKAPQVVFVNSMGDLFHPDVSEDFILKVFDVMRQAGHHTFQVLTKRPERLERLRRRIQWPENVWMGVSVETRRYLDRVDRLADTGARLKFVSFEPLLEGLGKVDLRALDWVIVGGESGPGARPLDEAWVRDIRDECLRLGIPFFFKQWGGANRKKAGRVLDGRTWDDRPRVELRADGQRRAR